ncbi:hypothetical protein [Nostoc sp.]|uniref:hypothetical protein n=1 Tax=Nostoc sp. TaxID=1180 RepID=UPI002FFD29E8
MLKQLVPLPWKLTVNSQQLFLPYKELSSLNWVGAMAYPPAAGLTLSLRCTLPYGMPGANGILVRGASLRVGHRIGGFWSFS